jgi:hypothetical protein
MGLGLAVRLEAPVIGGAANAQLGEEVGALVRELPRGRQDPDARSRRRDLRAIERVAAPLGFPQYRVEISVDGCARRGMRTEALELGVLPIAARASAKHRLREQSLPPERDQAARVEMARVQRPEPHHVVCVVSSL